MAKEECATRESMWRKRLDHEIRYHVRDGEERDYFQPRRIIEVAVIRAALTVFGLYERGMRNANDHRLIEHCFTWLDLPEGLDGFRILHCSDFHFMNENAPFLDSVVRCVGGVEVDLCVFTGDYRFGHFGRQDCVLAPMARVVSAIASRHGVIGVLGNHDVSDLAKILETLGIRMLVNAGMLLESNGARLWIGGIDDAHTFRSDHLPGALEGAPDDAFKLLLSHTPERIREAEARGVDLYLCGHTHGGQLCLPKLGAVVSNSRCPRRYTKGPWRYGSLRGYTTVGAGVTDVPVRFNCPPEAVLITLRRG
jgi:hypothetical protein